MISRQQRDVNRLPDPDLKLSAVASKTVVADQELFVHPRAGRVSSRPQSRWRPGLLKKASR